MQTMEQLKQALETNNVVSSLDEKLKPITILLEDLNKIVFKNNNMIIYWDTIKEGTKIPTNG